jgi:hypothetical protein
LLGVLKNDRMNLPEKIAARHIKVTTAKLILNMSMITLTNSSFWSSASNCDTFPTRPWTNERIIMSTSILILS